MIPAFTGRAAEYFVKERGRRRVVGRGPIAEGGRPKAVFGLSFES